MMHEKDDLLKVAEVMAKKIIQFENRCKYDEHKSEDIKCHELADIAALARMITADTGDVGC